MIYFLLTGLTYVVPKGPPLDDDETNDELDPPPNPPSSLNRLERTLPPPIGPDDELWKVLTPPPTPY